MYLHKGSIVVENKHIYILRNLVTHQHMLSHAISMALFKEEKHMFMLPTS